MFLYFSEYSWSLPEVTFSGLKTGWSFWFFLLISVRWNQSSIWSEDNYAPFLRQDLSDIQTNVYELLYFSVCVLGTGPVSSLTRLLISLIVLGSSFSSLRCLTHCAHQHSANHSEMCPSTQSLSPLSVQLSLLRYSGLKTVCFSLPLSASNSMQGIYQAPPRFLLPVPKLETLLRQEAGVVIGFALLIFHFSGTQSFVAWCLMS